MTNMNENVLFGIVSRAQRGVDSYTLSADECIKIIEAVYDISFEEVSDPKALSVVSCLLHMQLNTPDTHYRSAREVASVVKEAAASRLNLAAE